ncbi:MAG: ribosome silencing factor [Candidatus Hydrogenedentes bacterium]|nr:ribosome silencing factor [Candidatus Hydrogenedentota bacterium]
MEIAELAADHKAKDLKAYDVRGLTVIADTFVLCTATSEPQLKAIVGAVRDGMKEVGVPPLYVEGALSGGWMLMDYGDVILHVFREDARDFYDLDGLWADAPEIALGIDA